jgi:hypothetical protein
MTTQERGLQRTRATNVRMPEVGACSQAILQMGPLADAERRLQAGSNPTAVHQQRSEESIF